MIYRLSFINFLRGVRNVIILLCTSLLIFSCALKLPSIPDRTEIEIEEYEDVESYLSQAKKSPPAKQALLLFKASELLIRQNELEKASETLQVIFVKELPQRIQNEYHTLYAFTLANNNPTLSLEQLKQVLPGKLKNEYLVYYHKAASVSHSKLGNGINSFQAAIELDKYVSGEEAKQEVKQLMWQGLTTANVNSLTFYRQTYYEPRLLGWIDLAIIYQRYATDPEHLLSALRAWRKNHSNHEAYHNLPDDLKLAEKAQPYEIQQIALLLPFKGPYGNVSKAIRDGFIHSHMEIRRATSVKVYDTTDYYSVITAYQKALNEGANFVVGPLTKKNINELLNFYDSVPVPTLTLNRVDSVLKNDDNLYQFGLPIEDEAKQVAIRAWNSGKRSAVVLAPNTSKGKRAASTFESEFSALGGEIVAKLSFKPGENHQAAVKKLLGIDQSELRKNTIRYLLGKKLEFEPRRRKDADFIFLSSSYKDARQIKPFLNYYYANKLDVFATSNIFSGAIRPNKDKDLDGIIFCDIPWLIDKQSKFQQSKKRLAKLWPNATQSQARFFALGGDSYTIARELGKLRAFPRYRLDGLSGSLSVNNLGWVERALLWGTFKKGRPQLLPH